MQMILEVMSCVHMRAERVAAPETIKLIKWDGVVKIYEQPIQVSDVLMEYPKHLVCCSDSFYIGQKIPPLSLNQQLQPGHKYFLLPQHCFQIVLSFLSIASFRKSDDSLQPLLKKAASCRAFDILKSPSGSLRIRVSDEFISRLMQENEKGGEEEEEGLCTTPQLQKDYRLLVRSRHWKPKLETIRENKKEKKKKKRKLSTSNFGTKNTCHPKAGTHMNLHLQPPSKQAKNIKTKLRNKSF
ncbi:hypothetical protein M5689_008495 [Euphorbia peplus]|nr:hypothetical protein M5689_008495 [Euphorbia peplus]